MPTPNATPKPLSASAAARSARARRGADFAQYAPIGLSMAWEIVIGGEDCMNRSWPTTQMQRDEDVLAATFGRPPRRRGI